MLTHPIDQCPACRKALGPAEIIERWCEDCGGPTDKLSADTSVTDKPPARRPRPDRPHKQAA